MKLGLGTAQFGLDYGITNAAGKTPAAEVARILEEAHARGVRMLDTASLYGDSEAALGKSMPAGHAFRIVTKTPKFASGFGPAEARALEESFAASLKALGVTRVYGLLAHQADDLLSPGGERFLDALRALKDRGLVSKIGASVYSGSQIGGLLARGGIDLVQLPFNVLDQRPLREGHLKRLKEAGVEIHSRSVFLQGLLLMDPAAMPAYFGPLRATLEGFRATAAAHGLSPLQAALAFVAGRPEIDHFVVGVCDLAQFREILAAAQALPREAPDLSAFRCDEERFVNPSLWKIA